MSSRIKTSLKRIVWVENKRLILVQPSSKPAELFSSPMMQLKGCVAQRLLVVSELSLFLTFFKTKKKNKKDSHSRKMGKGWSYLFTAFGPGFLRPAQHQHPGLRTKSQARGRELNQETPILPFLGIPQIVRAFGNRSDHGYGTQVSVSFFSHEPKLGI